MRDPVLYRLRLPLLVAALALCGFAVADIQVTRKPAPGPDRVTARTRIDVPVDLLTRVLENPCHVHRWLPKVDRIELLPEDGEPGQLVYVSKEGGLFTSGRDAVLRFIREGSDPVTMTVLSVPDHLPEKEGFVRIPGSEARWSLSPEQGTTLVDYRQRLAVGGKVPQWLADRSSVGYVRDSLEALTEYAETLDSGGCPPDDR